MTQLLHRFFFLLSNKVAPRYCLLYAFRHIHCNIELATIKEPENCVCVCVCVCMSQNQCVIVWRFENCVLVSSNNVDSGCLTCFTLLFHEHSNITRCTPLLILHDSVTSHCYELLATACPITTSTQKKVIMISLPYIMSVSQDSRLVDEMRYPLHNQRT